MVVLSQRASVALRGTLWASVTLLYAAVGAPFAQPVDLSWRALLLHPITLEFVFGMLAARAVLSTAPWTVWVSSAVAVVALMCFVIDGMQRVHSLAIAGALVGLVRAEWRGWLRIGPILLLLGNASYAIYLVHMPLMSLVARTTRRLGPLATWPVNLLLSVSAALLLGVVYHLCYERIALQHARRLLARRVVQ